MARRAWFASIAFLLAFAGEAFAAPSGVGSPGSTNLIRLTNPLSCDDFEECVVNVSGALYVVAIPVVTVMVLYGGFQMMFAGGDPEKFKRGKNTVVYAAIGFSAVVLASGVVLVIRDVLGAR